LANKLNIRQLTLLKSALKSPGAIYTIQEYKNMHNIVYQTARKDLLELSDTYELLVKVKDRKSFLFIVPSDLHRRIKDSK
ncbi:Fic family protein, partial [bacterium]|nr:Fic family protein [bacterium]